MHEDWRDKLQVTINNFLGTAPSTPMPIKIIREHQQTARSGRIPLTDKMREELLSEMERTRIGSRKIFQKIVSPPADLNYSKIQSWLAQFQERWTVTTVSAYHFVLVMEAYKAEPGVHHPMINLNEEDRRKKYIAERKRTGLAGAEILNRMENPPDGLTAQIIQSWKSKGRDSNWNTIKTREDWFTAVIKCYQIQPDFQPTVSLDEESRREKLIAELERTGLGAIGIYNKMSNPPVDLNPNNINSWTNKNKDGSWDVATAREDWFTAVMEHLRNQPDLFKLDEKNRRENFLAERRRTGLGASRIFGKMPNKPDGLTIPIISTWAIKKDDGQWCSLTTDKDYFAAVMDFLKTQPDAHATINLNDEGRREKLIAEIERTGLGTKAIVNKMKRRSKGLNSRVIEGWVTRNTKGSWVSSRARSYYYADIMTFLKDQPDAKPMINLDEENRRTQLLTELERTGLGAIRILRQMQNRPEGLNFGVIDNWTAKRQGGKWYTSNAREDWFSSVMGFLKTQPTKNLNPAPQPEVGS